MAAVDDNEYDRLQEEIDKAEVYRKYLSEEISEIEGNMGLEFD